MALGVLFGSSEAVEYPRMFRHGKAAAQFRQNMYMSKLG